MLLLHSSLLCFFVVSVNGQYLVEVLKETPFGGHTLSVRCDATGADFGADVLDFSFQVNGIGCAIRTEPRDACNETHIPRMNGTLCINFFAIVPRGNCSFSEKAYRVQRAHPDLHAAIIFNKEGEAPIPMKGSDYADKVDIPVVMITYNCMQSILFKYPASEGYLVAIKVAPGYYDLFKYLIPFVAVVGFCFIILLVSLVIRLCRERRRVARKRLTRSNLRKIPTKKFKKGEQPETCAICLEDFVDGEKLRMLPCNHHYHCKCVDPWLTKNRKVCPVCKRKVGAKQGDSDSSDEERRADAAAGRSRENAPLLHNEMPVGTTTPTMVSYPYPNYRTVEAGDSGEAVGSLVLSPSASPGRNRRTFADPDMAGTSQCDRTTVRAIVHSGSDLTRDVDQEAPLTDLSSDSSDEAMETGDRSSTVSQALKDRFRPFVQNLIGRARRGNRTDRQPLTDLTQVDEINVRGEDNAGFDSPQQLVTSVRPHPSPASIVPTAVASIVPTAIERDDDLADVEQAESVRVDSEERRKKLKKRARRNRNVITPGSGSRDYRPSPPNDSTTEEEDDHYRLHSSVNNDPNPKHSHPIA